MDLNECMEFINSYSKTGGKITDLSRAEDLMQRLGDPHKKLKFVHIAGTNGKGSVTEYISNALIESGYRTGQFTSPYILRYTDRIRINGSDIDEESLCTIAEEVKSRVSDRPYSQFEITMAIAFLWYVREKCDIVVLETGIGGLLDSTNVIPPPLVSVITSISLDHTAILGDTVEKIAVQKAGIIKKGSAVILSEGNPISVRDIVMSTAEERGAEFIPCEPVRPAPEGGIFAPMIYRGIKLTPGMPGIHQFINAQTAITACIYLRSLGFEIPESAIISSVENTRIKARVQIIDGEPTVIVDGGHNPAGTSALAMTLMYFSSRGKKIYTVMGMVRSKDFVESVKKIAPLSDGFFAVDGFAPDTVPALDISDLADLYTRSEVCSSLGEAVTKAKTLALENGGIAVVCGSLYLASEYLNDI